MTGPLSKQAAGRWVFPGLVAIVVAAGYAAAVSDLGVWIFVVVMAGWVITLCLHEFAHAVTALAGGDTSVRARGYLTLNPFRYVNAAYSIVIPVVVLAIGGIPLPGGSVLIESHRLRSRVWSSLVSVAGPLTNLVLGIVLVSVANEKAQALIKDLTALEAQGLDVGIERTVEPEEAESLRLGLELLGADHPGIVAEISASLAQQRVSIEELSTDVRDAPMAGGTLFEARAVLNAPPTTSTEDLRKMLEALADELMVDITLSDD